MTYYGNQIKSITDAYTSQGQYSVKEYQNKAGNTSNEMSYDANGNMIKDLDRDIVTIKYNLLNLPDLIQFKNGCQIKNTYSADGQKLSSRYVTVAEGVYQPLNPGQVIENLDVNENDNVTVDGTDYLGNIEYQVDNLFKINISSATVEAIVNSMHSITEGYVSTFGINSSYGPAYNYYRKDHLGNNREVWNASYKWGSATRPAATNQITQYYPSGLPWKYNTGDNPGSQPYKFNGCEFIEMHGYDVTDLGNRGVHHATNRFTTMDRFCEKFPWQSPYVFAGNNPVNYVDVMGDSIWICYNDANGQQQRMLYTQGMNYKGDDSVIEEQINSLNAMYNTKNGATVLSVLSASKNHFNVTNGQSADGTVGFVGNEAGGGTLLMNNNNGLEYISHDMFHAFQHENGQGGRSIFNEVEAYLFSDGIVTQHSLDNNITSIRNSGAAIDESSMSITYQNAYGILYNKSSFSKNDFIKAVKLFKTHSTKNANAIYNNYPLQTTNQRYSLLKQFYPLW